MDGEPSAGIILLYTTGIAWNALTLFFMWYLYDEGELRKDMLRWWHVVLALSGLVGTLLFVITITAINAIRPILMFIIDALREPVFPDRWT